MPFRHPVNGPVVGCTCASCQMIRARNTARAQTVATVSGAWWEDGYRALENNIRQRIADRAAKVFDRAFLNGDDGADVWDRVIRDGDRLGWTSVHANGPVPGIVGRSDMNTDIPRPASPPPVPSWWTSVYQPRNPPLPRHYPGAPVPIPPPGVEQVGTWTPRPDPLPACVDCGETSVGQSATGVAFCDECAIDLDVEGWRPWGEDGDVQWGVRPHPTVPSVSARPNIPGDWSWVTGSSNISPPPLPAGAALHPEGECPNCDRRRAASSEGVDQVTQREYAAPRRRLRSTARRPENFANVTNV